MITEKLIIKKQDELISKLESMVDSGQDYDRDYHEIWVELYALKQQLEEEENKMNKPKPGICGDEGEYWRDEDGSVSYR